MAETWINREKTAVHTDSIDEYKTLVCKQLVRVSPSGSGVSSVILGYADGRQDTAQLHRMTAGRQAFKTLKPLM